MKSLIASICILGMVGMIVGIMVKAAETADVAATVTVQNISLTVTDGNVAYGTLANNTTQDTCTLTDSQTLTNNGNVTEKFNIKAIADVSTPDWTIGAVAGSNVYVHSYASASCPFSAAGTLTTSYAQLASDIAGDSVGTVTLNLQINTPNPSTVYTQQTVSVNAQAVAN